MKLLYNSIYYILLWKKTWNSTFRKRNHGVWFLFFWPRKINIFTTLPSLVFVSTFLSTSNKMHIICVYIHIYIYTWECKFLFFHFRWKLSIPETESFAFSQILSLYILYIFLLLSLCYSINLCLYMFCIKCCMKSIGNNRCENENGRYFPLVAGACRQAWRGFNY